MPNQNERNDANAKSIQIQAKSVDEAIELGLTQLGLSQEDVEVEVLNEGKRGVFGLGAEEAIVRLTPKTPPAVSPLEADDRSDEAQAAPASAGADDKGQLVDGQQVDEQQVDEQQVEEQPVEEGSVEAVAAQYLAGLLERMGITAKVIVRAAPELAEANETPPLVLDVTGKDLGVLIGRRSETLQVLQYMVRLMVSKHFNRWEPVIVDVESYRSRRRRSLQKMAVQMAERAISTNRRVMLEAMPPHERRLIHLALRDHPDVITKSIGSDENRKITIIPK